MVFDIIKGLFGLGAGWIEGKQKIQQAKIEREVTREQQQADWDTTQAEASKNSWKDEWLTILISIPMIMAFIPPMIPYVEAGFAALEVMPEWYQYLVGVVFAASFGIKKVSDVLTLKKK